MKNEFTRNLLTLSSGTVIAQIIPMLATLILSRLYTPDEMGEWGIFSSYAAILSVIACLKYDNAIVKPVRVVDAYNLSFISVVIGLIFISLLYILILIVDAFQYDYLFQLSRTSIYILPLYVLCLLCVQVLNNLANKTKQYSSLALSSIVRSITQAISRITLGYCSFTNIGLIIGAVLGAFLNVIVLVRKLRFIYYFSHCFSNKKSCDLVQQYKDFPKYDLLSNVLNSISSNIPVIILSYFFLDDVVGYFSMALTLLFIPMSIIGTSLGQLYYRDACELHEKNVSLSGLTKKIFIPTYIGCSIFMLVLIWGGEVIFSFLLGHEWATVGKYATYMSIWLLLVTSVSPLSSVFYVKNKQILNVYFNILGLFLRVVVLLIGGYYLHSSDLAILLFGIVSCLFFAVQGLIIKKMADVVFSNRVLAYLYSVTIIFLLSYLWKVFLWLN
ncbi:oligosaccharide flippase family protein [Bacteroides fragilis]|uniref:oligosaccharide flippase family protein n=1 Tax=Bacteroides hominis TaxID=2763023 RepID=UPI0022A343C4|nr:oligosaccharide flippase family protein [Bacteroides fragilis]